MKIEEQRTGVSDPTHFNYSMAAKSTRARRDNILKTVADLKDQQAAAQALLKDEETELRKLEILAEKELDHRPATRGSPTGFAPRQAMS
jgi:hypothetical protein